MFKSKTLAFSVLVLVLQSAVTFSASINIPADLDQWVAKAMKTFEVPGIGLAILKDGKVLVARGYGVKQLDSPQRVDEHTLFGIASNTKVFTAAALGMLCDEGKIAWDKPVITYLPSFAMWDPWVTRELTVRDLLVHRSGLGLGAGDLLWWPSSKYDRKDVVRRLRFIPPATSFRTSYAYDNVLYIVAGEVIEAVSGMSWEDFIAKRILQKIGMTETNVTHSSAGAGKNSARPHARIEGVVREIQPFLSDTTNPAGGINSSATDIAKWLLVLLAKGQLSDGSQLFSHATAEELMKIVTPIPESDLAPELKLLTPNFHGYALGLHVQDYRGHKLAMHTGGLPGYVSRVILIPDISLGIAVLTNQESREAYDAIAYHVADFYLNAPSQDWITAFQQAQKSEEKKNAAAVQKESTGRNKSSKPSLSLSKYAGSYVDDWYGNITIAMEGEKLVIRFVPTSLLIGDLEHWQYDTFVVKWRDRELRADAFITFSLNPDGSINHAKIQAVSPETDFSFDFQDLFLKPASETRSE